ncbi:MAG: GNAT family N-acetyltransferase [Candidatus Pacebacteria bacterium]|nr:GNAT family N-acetyltransferase [Candidatus Paceibacterota bacterium]
MNSSLPPASGGDLKLKEMSTPDDLCLEPGSCDVLLPPGQLGRKLCTGFACSERAVKQALRLRYHVFAVELGHAPGGEGDGTVDRDEYDEQMTHLVLLERDTGKVVGTYRVQTAGDANRYKGLYSAREYDLTAFRDYLPDAVECGRACIARDHRKATALLALWYGLRAYMTATRKRWAFGCSSISSVDPDDGWRTMKTLRTKGFLHPDMHVPATTEFSCGDPEREFDDGLGPALALPRLFAAYMRLGARVISQPAIDREFGTIDFLVMADGLHVNMARLGLTQ